MTTIKENEREWNEISEHNKDEYMCSMFMKFTDRMYDMWW